MQTDLTAALPVSFDDVRAASAAIDGLVIRTPTLPSPRLSAATGASVFVKYETLQATGSFKDRGAANRLLHLTEDERRRGVVTLSAGNHAQAVAFRSSELGVPATIVMPVTTPSVKVARTEAYGARVKLEGETIAECQEAVRALMEAEGLTLVHPYDDPLVMAGQGTVGIEMLAAAPELDCIVVPVGGGGLISGVAVAAKAINPDIEIIGVEVAGFPSMVAALRGEAAQCGGDTLAEGIAVKNVSATAVEIARHLVSDVVTVEEDHIEGAIYAFLVQQHTLAEGAGAASLAALSAQPERFAGRRVGLILTGGNIDPRLLSAITVRALERADQVVGLRVTVRDRPGELARVTEIIGREKANILEVSHHRMLLNVPAMRVTIDLALETRDKAHAERLVGALKAAGMSVSYIDPFTAAVS
ncbi:threonine ammonia-lyase [Lutibaculum baratangense]|uniref:L-serine dehydratase n=1 Tax=Lutibaculum baratangense AMV1 TaxID=631454 RepID=V4RAP5_9HYPH|nr:threonine ammonia-lyase [Lutibaculum baratangense]ESR23251.1 Threonine dehydratase [Lutibaculum baratangense AMV1]